MDMVRGVRGVRMRSNRSYCRNGKMIKMGGMVSQTITTLTNSDFMCVELGYLGAAAIFGRKYSTY